jgi:DNA-directed RNA polymerase sigma subunit (sigma70/sigma32)
MSETVTITRCDGETRTFRRGEKRAMESWRQRGWANLVHKHDDHNLTSYQSIADYLGISKERVRQIEAKAIAKLKAALCGEQIIKDWQE